MRQSLPPKLPSKLPENPRAHETALTRRRQAVGLLLLALAILAVVLLRAPAHFLFPTGWWRF